MTQLNATVRMAVAEALKAAASALEEPEALMFRPRRPPEQGGWDPNVALVYVAGCSSLCALSRRVGVPIFKIGATQQRLLDRQKDLRGDRFAGAVRRNGGYELEPGFDDWEMCRIETVPLAADSLIALAPRAFRVSLKVPFATFEDELHKVLRPRSLEAWARSGAGLQHLKDRNVDADVMRRFTLYGFGADNDSIGDDVRPSRCAELYVLRPRQDRPHLIEAIRRAAGHQTDVGDQPAPVMRAS